MSAHELAGVVPVTRETPSTRPSTLARPGVFVDVGGTLLDTDYLHALVWARASSDVGEWAPMNAIHRFGGMGADHVLPELLGRDIGGGADAQGRHFDQLKREVRPLPGTVGHAGDAQRSKPAPTSSKPPGTRTGTSTSSPINA